MSVVCVSVSLYLMHWMEKISSEYLSIWRSRIRYTHRTYPLPTYYTTPVPFGFNYIATNSANETVLAMHFIILLTHLGSIVTVSTVGCGFSCGCQEFQPIYRLVCIIIILLLIVLRTTSNHRFKKKAIGIARQIWFKNGNFARHHRRFCILEINHTEWQIISIRYAYDPWIMTNFTRLLWAN